MNIVDPLPRCRDAAMPRCRRPRSTSAIQDPFARLGVEPRQQSVAEIRQLLRTDWDAMGVAVKALGAKVD